MGNGAMKTPLTQNSPEINPSIFNTTMTHVVKQEVGYKTKMDKMKKFLSSPSTRKKNTAPTLNSGQPGTLNNSSSGSSATYSENHYFGVPLEEIIKRECTIVPHLVTKVCMYIYEHGMESEGVFRINASGRTVEALKASFDRTGDADFDEAGDVMAVAALLKLFLRELPETLIPEHLTASFLSVQQEYETQPGICLTKLRALLQKLSQPHYETLKFIVKFLILVSKKSNVNKMNPQALGIVFGPNLFSLSGLEDRCGGGLQGLMEQGITNHIALRFITTYDRLFLEEGEESPHSAGFVLTKPVKKKIAPPRPPKPKLDAYTDIPNSRKTADRPEVNIPSLDLGLEAGKRAAYASSPSDDELLDTCRSNSPFALESDRSEFSAVASPRTLSTSNKLLDKVISSTVKEYVFGESSQNSEDITPQKTTAPIPPPRIKQRQAEKSDTNSASPEKSKFNKKIPVNEKKSEPHTTDASNSQEDSRPKKQLPTSKAFALFEEKGLLIGMAPSDMTKTKMKSDGEEKSMSGLPRPSKQASDALGSQSFTMEEPSDWNDVPHNPENILRGFKRNTGPSNRRVPQRRRPQVSHGMETKTVSTNNEESDEPPEPRPFLAETQNTNHKPDASHSAKTPSISFLNKRDHTSPDKSPIISRKPYVPPLDLSILHEHGDGSEPIPAEQGYSISLQKANQYKEGEVAVLSPRTSKLKSKKNHNDYLDNHDRRHRPCHLGYQMRPYLSAHPNTDVPPSPPTDQTHIQSKRSIDDENTMLVKQLTKKIQSCKKQIKLFEEDFEQIHGYRPSQTDKAAVPEVKRNMQELQRARKELRRVKEEIENEQRATMSSPSGLAVLPNGHSIQDEETTPSDKTSCMEETLQLILHKLEEKRAEDNRPEDLAAQTREQMMQEKLAMQKALLHFESIHGRPTTKAGKSLMRPLYARYRDIKKTLAKLQSPRDKSTELESVPEGQTLEFIPTPCTAESSKRDAVHLLTAEHDEEPEDFMVTKDLHAVGDGLYSVSAFNQELPDSLGVSYSLHELSVSQLLEEQRRARAEKKRLHKILKEFEADFFRQTGSKVQREDRAPMEEEYQEYKQVKARLKLMEALLSKHDPLSAF